MIAGIDPGLSGAIAFLDERAFVVKGVRDMPTMARAIGKGNAVNAAALANLLTLVAELDGVVIEAIYGTPPLRRGKGGEARRAGVASTFSFGEGYGCLVGVVAALGLRAHYVHASQWKRRAGLLGKDKDAARALAMQRHPEAAPWLARKKDAGRAEAILLASLYAEELMQGKGDALRAVL